MEAAAELVVDAAAGHAGQGVPQHLERTRVAGALPDAQDRFPGHGLRELGRLAEAAVALVELAREPEVRADQDLLGQRAGRAGEALGLLHALHELAAGFQDLAAAAVVGVRDGLEEAREGRHAVAVHRREVGAAVERYRVRREEDGHRPAAATGHGLHRLHVDLVHVGALLAIHLDGHEEAVHERGDLVVLERLTLHDVTPVAGRVAHREQHRPVLAPRELEGVRAPRVPVYRVVGVLEQVRAGLGGEPVRGTGRGRHARGLDQARGVSTNGSAATRAGCSPAPSTTLTAVPGSKCSRRT